MKETFRGSIFPLHPVWTSPSHHRPLPTRSTKSPHRSMEDTGEGLLGVTTASSYRGLSSLRRGRCQPNRVMAALSPRIRSRPRPEASFWRRGKG
jgi:hypothetical protein